MVHRVSPHSIFELAENSWPVVAVQQVVDHEAACFDSAEEAKVGFQSQSGEGGDENQVMFGDHNKGCADTIIPGGLDMHMYDQS